MIATAFELFGARHYPGVVALCTDALEDEPECLPLLLLRARARIALRRDLDAQADLRDIIRLDPRCGAAYRLLGELAARSDENEAAANLFLEALRIDPDDREATDWLLVVEPSLRPAAGAATLPASSPAAGRLLSPRAPNAPSRFARGTEPPELPNLDERPTRPFRPASAPPPALAHPRLRPTTVRPRAASAPPAVPTPAPTLTGHPAPQPPAKEAPRPTSRTTTRGVPDLPGFGEYLVANGILSRERLRAAQAYQRSMRVQLSTAIITLGLANPQRIQWAAIAHQSQLLPEGPDRSS